MLFEHLETTKPEIPLGIANAVSSRPRSEHVVRNFLRVGPATYQSGMLARLMRDADRFCRTRYGVEIDDTYIECGQRLSTPRGLRALDAAVRDAAAGKYSILLVDEVAQVAGNLHDLVVLLQTLASTSVTIVVIATGQELRLFEAAAH